MSSGTAIEFPITAHDRASRVFDQVDRRVGGFLRGIQQVAGGQILANAITGAIRSAQTQAISLARGLVTAGAEADSLIQSLDQVSGGRGAAVFASIRSNIGAMPVALDAATKAYANLRRGGIEPTIEDLKAMAAVAGQMQGDAGANINRLSEAVARSGQNVATGKEGLNETLEQLRRAGIPVIKILSQELRLTERQMTDLGAAGVSTQDILNATFRWMRRQAAASGDSWNDMTQKARNVWGEFQRQIMDSGPFEAMKSGLDDLLSYIESAKGRADLERWADDLGAAIIEAFAGGAKAADVLLSAVDSVRIAYNGLRWVILQQTRLWASLFDAIVAGAQRLPGMAERLAEVRAYTAALKEASKEAAGDSGQAIDEILKANERRRETLRALEEKIRSYSPDGRPRQRGDGWEPPAATVIPGGGADAEAAARRLAAEREIHGEIIRLTQGEVAWRQWAAEQTAAAAEQAATARLRVAEQESRQAATARYANWVAAGGIVEPYESRPAIRAAAALAAGGGVDDPETQRRAEAFRAAGVDEKTIQEYLAAARAAAETRRKLETQLHGELLRLTEGAMAYQLWALEQEIEAYQAAGVDKEQLARYDAAVREQVATEQREAVESQERQLLDGLARMTLSRVDYERWALAQQLRAWEAAGVETVKLERYKQASLRRIRDDAEREEANGRERQQNAVRMAIQAQQGQLAAAVQHWRAAALDPQQYLRDRRDARRAERQEERETRRLERTATRAADRAEKGGWLSTRERLALRWAQARRVQQEAEKQGGGPMVNEQKETNRLLTAIRQVIQAGGLR